MTLILDSCEMKMFTLLCKVLKIEDMSTFWWFGGFVLTQEKCKSPFFDRKNQHSAAVICKEKMHDIFSEMAAEFFVECSLNVSYQKSIYPRIDCHLELNQVARFIFTFKKERKMKRPKTTIRHDDLVVRKEKNL